jgi:hypothetical protein
MGHLAFLGHSSTDSDVVSRVASALKARGISYWLDSEQIKGGDNFLKKIQAGFESTTAFVAFIGENGVKGKWQDLEIEQAILEDLFAELEDVCPQSCPVHRRLRFSGRGDCPVSNSLCVPPDGGRDTAHRTLQRHRTSNGDLDLATASRSDSERSFLPFPDP